MLPSRRGEGDRCDRNRARAQPGRAQPRARSAARLWQHERPDRAVRARTADRAGPARTGPDDRLRTRLHLRRAAARSRVISACVAVLLIVTLQRLVEVCMTNVNT